MENWQPKENHPNEMYTIMQFIEPSIEKTEDDQSEWVNIFLDQD